MHAKLWKELESGILRGRWNLSWTPGAEIRVKLFLCRVQPLLQHKGWHCGLIVYLKQTLQEQFPSFILQYDCTVATDISTWFQTKILWSEWQSQNVCSFSKREKFPFFSFGNKTMNGWTEIYTISKIDFLFLDTGLLFPRIRAPRATFTFSL